MTEVWRKIEGYPGYSVSSLGNIRGLTGKILSQATKADGYKIVTILANAGKRCTRYVHRLVAVAFIENSGCKAMTNHIDGDRGNNSAANLEPSTAKENRNRQVYPAKEKKGRRVIQLNTDGEFVREWVHGTLAAKTLRISQSCIQACCAGKQKTSGGWGWKYYDEYVEAPLNEEWHQLPAGLIGQVSSLGRIKTKTGSITIGHLVNGYRSFYNHQVHRLVATAFPNLCPKAEGRDVVNHKDGVRTNNAASNLEWVTKSENTAHAYFIGLSSRQIAVRRILPNGSTEDYPSMAEAARQMGLSAASISLACSGAHKKAGGSLWEKIAEPVCEDPENSIQISNPEMGALIEELVPGIPCDPVQSPDPEIEALIDDLLSA